MPTVEVVCDDRSHREERRWTVARIEHREDPKTPGRFAWIPNLDDLAGTDPLQLLIGDDHMTLGGNPVIYDASDGARDSRATWTLHCLACGRRARIRAEKMDPILDTLAQHDIGSITLTALAARV